MLLTVNTFPNGNGDVGYLREKSLYTVSDSLVVKPTSPSLAFSVIKELSVPFSDIEEIIVQVGKEEVSKY